MGLLIPRIRWSKLPVLLGYAVIGALVAGIYGALHDQVSYTISEEYFTKFKFEQFADANLGLPPRVFAAQIGFLATWWVGLIAGWILARARINRLPQNRVFRELMLGYAILMGAAILGGIIGLTIGHIQTLTTDLSGWSFWERAGVTDLANFARVGCLHNGSYLGALAGLAAAIILLRRRSSPAPSQ